MSDLSKTRLTTIFVLGAALILPGVAVSAQTAAASAPAVVSGDFDAKVIARRGADDATKGGKKQKQKRKHTGTDDGPNHT